MANPEHLARIKDGVEEWNRWREECKEAPDFSYADLRQTEFSRANLSQANFWNTNLSKANFSKANLSKAILGHSNLSGADLTSTDLSYADLSYTDLSYADLSYADLSYADLGYANLSYADLWQVNLNGAGLIKANLSKTDLRNVHLSGVNFSGACFNGNNLSDLDLSGSNLSGSNLSTIQALDTNFTSARLTGACIEDWNINFRTNLQDVICEFIFIQYDKDRKEFVDRRPHDPNATFKPGEFAALVQQSLETVDLIFLDGIDWKAFLASLKDLQAQYGDELSVQGVEKKAGGAFLVRLEVPPESNKGAIERLAKDLYETKLQLLEASYRAELQAKDREIAIYKQQSADVMELAKLAASRPITVEAKAVVENNQAPKYNLQDAKIGNLVDTAQLGSRIQAIQHNYASEAPSLAEAAAEIQKLLQQLEQTNPAATEEEQKAFVNAMTPPPLRQRAVSALVAGGEAALVELPYGKVIKAVIEGWRESGRGRG